MLPHGLKEGEGEEGEDGVEDFKNSVEQAQQEKVNEEVGLISTLRCADTRTLADEKQRPVETAEPIKAPSELPAAQVAPAAPFVRVAPAYPLTRSYPTVADDIDFIPSRRIVQHRPRVAPAYPLPACQLVLQGLSVRTFVYDEDDKIINLDAADPDNDPRPGDRVEFTDRTCDPYIIHGHIIACPPGAPARDWDLPSLLYFGFQENGKTRPYVFRGKNYFKGEKFALK
ncbi:hypothetical protein BJ878DRAFT_481998 [Calycina marina]|uniref:Uncharacterized protein n=1 Tax=Calycina marina TaxID=1763456 RepID=A0A9P8CDC8_9HELO|nr:hypothetical protein BJ878DRAFT_481998 [Calycina marina]